MKRTNILTSVMLITAMILLTGCGSKATAGAANPADLLAADYENALPVESQLVLGTLLLEDTENAVTVEQAEALLPLWQMMKELESSDTVATQEVGGLIEQIQQTMTQEQIQAISAMKLTQSDTFAYMQKAGMGPQRKQSGTPDASGATGGEFTGGGMAGGPPAGFEGGGPEFSFEGGMPGGGGGPAGGGGMSNQDLSAEQIATLQARRENSGASQGASSLLLDSLIALLEAKQG